MLPVGLYGGGWSRSSRDCAFIVRLLHRPLHPRLGLCDLTKDFDALWFTSICDGPATFRH